MSKKNSCFKPTTQAIFIQPSANQNITQIDKIHQRHNWPALKPKKAMNYRSQFGGKKEENYNHLQKNYYYKNKYY